MKVGDRIRVKLSGDIYTVEVVKENARTVLIRMPYSYTRIRKVSDGGPMPSLPLPIIVKGEKIVKVNKAKIVTPERPEPAKPKTAKELLAEILERR